MTYDNHKRTVLVSALLGLALALGGCSSKEEPAATPKVAQSPEGKTAPEVEAKPAPSKTLNNAITAFNGESNANKRYEAFAKKADEEGYLDVANLFRAAARAESIHAADLAGIITAMGGDPTPILEAPVVKTTAENLAAALAGETEEFSRMYPEYIAAAKTEGKMDAVRVFNGAKAAEETHAKFYKDATENLDGWKTDTRTFYVCSVCGYTVAELTFDNCPICFVSKDKYIKVD